MFGGTNALVIPTNDTLEYFIGSRFCSNPQKQLPTYIKSKIPQNNRKSRHLDKINLPTTLENTLCMVDYSLLDILGLNVYEDTRDKTLCCNTCYT